MKTDKKLILDLLDFWSMIIKFLSTVWHNKIKLLKWFLILLAFFALVIRIRNIIVRRRVLRRHNVVKNFLIIKKRPENYKIGLYFSLNQNNFSKRENIAPVFFNKKKVLGYLIDYRGNIFIHKNIFSKFVSSENKYKHLLLAAKINNYNTYLNPYFIFYLDFGGKNNLTKLLYTPINIPDWIITNDYIVIKNIKNEIKNKNKLNIKIDRFIYLYPVFKRIGDVPSVKAVFIYRYNNYSVRKFYSKPIKIYSGKPVNIYKVLKDGMNKVNNFRLLKINIEYSVPKNKKGAVKFHSLKLIRPNILPIEEVFERFIYKKYFIKFMNKSSVFKNELNKRIYERGKYSLSKRTIKNELIKQTLNNIFLVDYLSKIRHISDIHDKMVRAFYMFIYKGIVRKDIFSEAVSLILSTLFQHRPKPFYKNIFIPVNPKYVSLKIVKSQINKTKTLYIKINCNEIKLYRYFTNDKKILESITDGNNIGAGKDIIFRGSNDDYRHEKYYYEKYPVLKKINLIAFGYIPSKIESYFYFNRDLVTNYNFLNKSSLDLLFNMPILKIEDINSPYEELFQLKMFISGKTQLDSLFSNGGGWVYKDIRLGSGKYLFNTYNNKILKTREIFIEKIKNNEK